MVGPGVSGLYYALTDWSGIGKAEFISLDNFVALFREDLNFWAAFRHNLFWVAFFLIIIYVALNSPCAIFLLRSFLVKFPPDFEEAARVNGATEIQVLTRVVMPIMWPGLLTVALGVWGEFQIALIFMQKDEKMPITTSYFNFMRRFSRDWSLTSAGAMMILWACNAVLWKDSHKVD